MSERCALCGAEAVSFGPDSDHGEHDVDGESCLRRRLAAEREALAELRQMKEQHAEARKELDRAAACIAACDGYANPAAMREVVEGARTMCTFRTEMEFFGGQLAMKRLLDDLNKEPMK